MPTKNEKTVANFTGLEVDVSDDGKTTGNVYFEIQRPLIHLIEEFLLTHPVDGRRMLIKTFSELAGVPVGTVTGIITGHKWVAKSSRETVEKIAAVLEIPVLQIYILSGFIRTTDMAYTTSAEETVDAIYRTMVKDKRMTYRAPVQAVWDTWPMSAKLALCMMYEQMIEKILFRYAAG